MFPEITIGLHCSWYEGVAWALVPSMTPILYRSAFGGCCSFGAAAVMSVALRVCVMEACSRGWAKELREVHFYVSTGALSTWGAYCIKAWLQLVTAARAEISSMRLSASFQ